MSLKQARRQLSLRMAIASAALALLIAFSLANPWATTTHAQTSFADQERDELAPLTAANQTVLMQYGTAVGSGNTLTITRIPILTTVGTKTTTTYNDVTLQFTFDAKNNLILATGYPKVVVSPNLTVSSFKAGTYLGPGGIDSGKMGITVSGPGIGTGVTVWSLAAAQGYDACTFPNSATWFVGPIASNPYYARLKAAGITSSSVNYGVLGSQTCYPAGTYTSYWEAGSLIGVTQNGNSISIASYSYESTTDYSTPRDQITYVLKP